MTRYILIAYTNAAPGRQEDYLRWYEDVHLPDVVAFDGVTSGQVFAPIDPGDGPVRFATVYEYDTDDPRQVLDDLIAAAGTRIRTTDTMDIPTVDMKIYRPVTAKVTKSDVKA